MQQTNTLAAPITTRLTRNQIRGFWVARGGWALDGMDSFIYALAFRPAGHADFGDCTFKRI